MVRETCDELLATFASPEGGFYSATDADSEGEEGKYFVWSEAQIRAVLRAGEETELFLRHYGVTAAGNFELGNVLAQVEANEEVTRRLAREASCWPRAASVFRPCATRRSSRHGTGWH